MAEPIASAVTAPPTETPAASAGTEDRLSADDERGRKTLSRAPGIIGRDAASAVC